MKYWINDGSILTNGSISWGWLNILFWRTFFVLILHYLALIITVSLQLKIAAHGRQQVDIVPDSIIRPSDETATMFAFVR